MDLRSLIGAGRRHSATDQEMVQAIHDQAVGLGAMCQAAESIFHRIQQASLQEMGLSHSEIEKMLRSAIKRDYPTAREVWIRDVYDDTVIYTVYLSSLDDPNDGQTFQRSYAIVDGNVTLGDPVQVQVVTAYVPVTESDALDEVIRYEGGKWVLYSRDGKKKLGEFDTKEAAVKRERQIQFFKQQEGKREGIKASSSVELTSDLVPLTERAVKADGTVKIKIIAPGKGSSGYYPPEVLKRDGPRVFTEGLHMYLDHPTPEEESGRPERSVRDLAGVLVSPAQWVDNGPAGPGLYAEAKVRSDVAPLIEELAPYIGVSIRALGRLGERDGERVVESIEQARSVDFVTVPGAGGKVLELFESARGRRVQEEEDVDLQETQRVLQEQAAEIARLREALTLREARDLVESVLRTIPMPDLTRQRLIAELSGSPPMTSTGTLDTEALTKTVQERARAELDYLARVTGGQKVVGMGTSGPPSVEDQERILNESFARLLGDEKLAAIAAAGRG